MKRGLNDKTDLFLIEGITVHVLNVPSASQCCQNYILISHMISLLRVQMSHLSHYLFIYLFNLELSLFPPKHKDDIMLVLAV